ncbi:MAG: hypothetical protein AB7G11_17325 [Phycisphaerales bacterium]
MMLLAWRPFLDPLNVHDSWWWFLIPMAFGISVVYKAARMPSLDRYWRAVLAMTVQIIVGMILLALASYLFVMLYVRFIASFTH